ncbi:MAG: hypothetical protein IT330_04295, partial [Anaerolineae bacterium]|nr:hypothetical protein [Anaerolineae bacterium]
MKKGLTRRDLLKVSVGAVGGGIAATYGQAALHTQTPEATPTPVPTQAVETKSQAGLYAGAALEGKTGRLWGLEFDPHLETYRRLAILFQRKTGAALNVEPQPNHAFEFRLVAAQAAGTQPDLACIMGKHCVPLYMRGALLPLGYSLYKEMKIKPEEVFFEDAVLSYSWKDEIYGVPVEAGGLGNVVNVPVDDVRSLGLAHQYPPSDGRVWFQDYPEMFALARALQHEEHGEVVRWGLSSKGFDSSSYIGILRSLLAERGTDWWDLANAKFNVDTEEGVQAMKWFVEDPV